MIEQEQSDVREKVSLSEYPSLQDIIKEVKSYFGYDKEDDNAFLALLGYDQWVKLIAYREMQMKINYQKKVMDAVESCVKLFPIYGDIIILIDNDYSRNLGDEDKLVRILELKQKLNEVFGK